MKTYIPIALIYNYIYIYNIHIIGSWHAFSPRNFEGSGF